MARSHQEIGCSGIEKVSALRKGMRYFSSARNRALFDDAEAVKEVGVSGTPRSDQAQRIDRWAAVHRDQYGDSCVLSRCTGAKFTLRGVLDAPVRISNRKGREFRNDRKWSRQYICHNEVGGFEIMLRSRRANHRVHMKDRADFFGGSLNTQDAGLEKHLMNRTEDKPSGFRDLKQPRRRFGCLCKRFFDQDMATRFQPFLRQRFVRLCWSADMDDIGEVRFDDFGKIPCHIGTSESSNELRSSFGIAIHHSRNRCTHVTDGVRVPAAHETRPDDSGASISRSLQGCIRHRPCHLSGNRKIESEAHTVQRLSTKVKNAMGLPSLMRQAASRPCPAGNRP